MMVLAATSLWQNLLAVATLMICFLLIVVILLQRGRGGGVAAAFGGGGTTSAFGTKTGDVFTLVTVVLAFVFLLVAVAGNYAFRRPAAAVEERPAAVPVDDEQDVADLIKELEKQTPQAGESSEAPAPAGEPASPDAGGGRTDEGVTQPDADTSPTGSTAPASTEPASTDNAAADSAAESGSSESRPQTP